LLAGALKKKTHLSGGGGDVSATGILKCRTEVHQMDHAKQSYHFLAKGGRLAERWETLAGAQNEKAGSL